MRIDEQFRQTGVRPILFHTIVDHQVREEVLKARASSHDFLNTFVSPLEHELGVKAEPVLHRTHGMENRKLYDDRIEAVNFALANDDGITTKEYEEADIILIGVSRCGKTPTSLYLALQFGIRAANYPFIEQDMGVPDLPAALKANRHKLFGLTIAPQRLHEIRNQRRANSRYSSLEQCEQELACVERLFRRGDPLPRHQFPLGGGDQRQDPRGHRPAPSALLSSAARRQADDTANANKKAPDTTVSGACRLDLSGAGSPGGSALCCSSAWRRS